MVSRGRSAEREKGDGKTRYEKRVKSKFANNVRNYNKIDMNKLFRSNILDVNIEIKGETDDYLVTMSFGGFLDTLRDELERRDSKLDLRIIIRALLQSFNSGDVYIRCTCPDWHYRMGYWASVDNIITGNKEIRPSKITNPNNKLGPGCKHVMLVLSNTGWIIKVGSVVNNYINYMEKHQKSLYAKIIYPAIYGKKYEEPVQTSIFDDDDLETGSEFIDKSNEEGRVRGRFSSTNQPARNPSIRKIQDRNNKEENPNADDN